MWIRNPRCVNHICGVMVYMLALSVLNRVFEPGQIKGKIIKLVFFSAKLQAKTMNRDNVSLWSVMSTRKLLFQ
jgi:hypothetical protein